MCCSWSVSLVLVHQTAVGSGNSSYRQFGQRRLGHYWCSNCVYYKISRKETFMFIKPLFSQSTIFTLSRFCLRVKVIFKHQILIFPLFPEPKELLPLFPISLWAMSLPNFLIYALFQALEAHDRDVVSSLL